MNEEIRAAIAPVREELLRHPIYDAITTLPRLRVLMMHHVFAVWDFMSLAKRLQRDLTSLDELWLPPKHPSMARFINSVILSEESDLDAQGKAASHFELYLAAMCEVDAPVDLINGFITSLHNGVSVRKSLDQAPAGVRQFVLHTVNTVREGSTVEALSSFLFGREDLIPDMFARLLRQWDEAQETRNFAYYIKRHIGLGGQEHGPMGMQALEELIGESQIKKQEAVEAAISGLRARIALWDSVLATIE